MSFDMVLLWIVHRGGLMLDLSLGFLLFFDVTRPIGFLLGGSFHFINSQLFHIGMFCIIIIKQVLVLYAPIAPSELFAL